jgi:hypothetical protein
VTSELGPDAGLLGAAWAVFGQVPHKGVGA